MPTTIHDTGITFPDLTTQTTAASAGGQIQTQIFTSPGTWTKPASCTQVRVTVIGGGLGAGQRSGGYDGQAGGTSSFGSLVSATGGSWLDNPGSGTVSTGTALKTGAVFGPLPFSSSVREHRAEYGAITGNVIVTGLTGNPTYSTGSTFIAGAAGQGTAPFRPVTDSGFYTSGFGGLAIAVCPVSSPVPVTVGTGGAFNPTLGNITSGSGVGGAVVVEFVG